MSTEVALIEIKNPLQAFSTPKGLDAVIDKIEAEVRNIDRDISTATGRDNIRSIAHKLAKSKNALDKMGKELTEEQRAIVAAVNAERSRAWDRMEALQEEIRKPLTDWENAEKERVAAHEAALLDISNLAVFADIPNTVEIEKRIKSLSEFPKRDWQEFDARYSDAVKTVSGALETRLSVSKKQDADRLELERLQKAEQERIQKERDEKLQAEAAAKAKTEAEAKAKKEADDLAAKVKADAEKAERDRLAIEAEKKAAEEREKAAVAAKDAAEKKAKEDAIAAEQKAIRDKELAVQAERDRAEKIKKEEAEAAAKREADVKHKAKINNEILAALSQNCNYQEQGISPDLGKAIIEAIVKGKIPHVTVKY